MPVEELLPRCLSAPFGRRFNSMASENVGDCVVCQHMSQIRQGSLNPSITPIPILLCHPRHEFCNLGCRSRPSHSALSTATSIANLLPEHTIFFNQIINDAVLMLIHPAGNRGHQK